MENPRLVTPGELAAVRPRAAVHLDGHPLYTLGDLDALAAPTVAIVGTRAPSDAGQRRARLLAAELASAGICIVSGLALGIDAAAHEGSLDAGGPTIGVLGGGHACFFPRLNRTLAERMLAFGGAVLSPFPPDRPAFRAQFLARNGLVAALSDAVLVVEAAARSGALNTASWAADLGVPVLAIPGEVDRPKAAGCLALIRDGATLARGAGDVLELVGWENSAPPRRRAAHPEVADSPAEAITALLADGERSLDELIERSRLTSAEALAALACLEIDGRVVRCPDGSVALTTPPLWPTGGPIRPSIRLSARGKRRPARNV